MKRSILLAGATASFISTNAFAAPTTLPDRPKHEDSPFTIHWELDGTKDGSTRHNHRSWRDLQHTPVSQVGNDKSNFPDTPYNGYHCWNNRTSRYFENDDTWGHCFIDPLHPLRIKFDTSVPAKARDDVRDIVDRINGLETDTKGLELGIHLDIVEDDASEFDFTIDFREMDPAGQVSVSERRMSFDVGTWHYGTGYALHPFYSVAVHEFGHLLGLHHVADGVMSYDASWFPLNSDWTWFDKGALDGLHDLYSQPLLQNPHPYWTDEAGSRNGSLNGWIINAHDKFYAGDFDGDGLDEIFATQYEDGWACTMEFDGQAWRDIENNGGEGKFGKFLPWDMGEDDHVLIGNFDGQGPTEEVMFFTTDELRSSLFSYREGVWEGRTSLSSPLSAYTYYEPDAGLAPNEVVAGNFNGGDRDLIFTMPQGIPTLHRFDETQGRWSPLWAGIDQDNPEGTQWYQLRNDANLKLVPGDFDADGQDEILVFSGKDESQGYFGQHWIADFDGENWSFSGGSDIMGLWTIRSGHDEYIAGEFNGRSGDDILILDADGYSHTIEYFDHLGEWNIYATNKGSGHIGSHRMTSADVRVAGQFVETGRDHLLTVDTRDKVWYVDGLATDEGPKSDDLDDWIDDEDESELGGCSIAGSGRDGGIAFAFMMLAGIRTRRRRRRLFR